MSGRTSRTVTLVYTAELRGNLVPCACPARPLGGLARRVGWIDSLRTARTDPLFVVDAGSSADLLQTYPGMPASEQDGIARLLDDGVRASGYDARVGGSDAPPGLRPNEARRVQRGGATLAFVAVDERIDPAPAAGAVRALGSVDLLIVLCSGDFHFATTAAQLLRPDVVVVARGATFPEPIRQDGAVFLGPGADGKYVGVARISCGKPPRTIEARLRPMDASVPASAAWEERIETVLVGLESRHPGALSRGE